MKRYFSLFVFLPVAVFLFAYSWAQELPEIIIEDADATTTIDLVSPPADFFVVDNPPFLLPDEAAICHADAREVIDLATPPEDFFDASEADLRLSDEVAICRADERLTIDLVAPPEEFFDPAPEATDKFVYVALGDSYQSGEGAGNSIQDSTQYLNEAYEQGTYTDTLVPGNDSCHRALQNYAKINKNKFHPELNDEDIVLIDLTCSGAKIETGPRPPVVGDVASNQIAPNSQLQQALNKLGEAGLTPADVDLVTVGMGGNDAGFVGVAYACLIPNLIRKILAAYPGAPWTAESEFVLKMEKMSSCKEADKATGINSDQAINDLLAKETWAQNMLLSAFPEAHILQLNYPNILPKKEIAPEWCSGINKDDVNYARERIERINQKIKEALENTAAQLGDDKKDYLKLVDVEKSFGSNALCPSNSSLALANEIKESNFDAEVRRLLNLDDNGDQIARALVDNIADKYNDYKGCMLMNSIIKMTSFPANICDEDGKWSQLMDDGMGLINYIENEKLIIRANLTKSPDSGEDVSIRYDRSFGLFHPNAQGHALTACNILAAHNGANPNIACPVASGVITAGTVNDSPITVVPINIIPGEKIDLVLRGFGPFSSTIFWVHSMPINLGTFIADAEGTINAQITLPDIGPGVHTIVADGQAANGAGIVQQLRVNYPGNPAGNSDYGMYLTGFTPNDGTDSEQVDIIYNDRVFATKTPDEAGGIFVEIPVFNQEEINIIAKSQTTGQEVTQTVDVIADNIAPTTKATTSGTMGQQNYYRGNVTVNLVASDTAQEGIDPSGILSIFYKIDDNDIVAVAGAATDIAFTAEGAHTLTYFSQDNAGNKEVEKTLSIIIDNIPPELTFGFDQTKKDLVFTATDDISGPDNIAITDQNGVVTATDQAGNTTKLVFNEKNRKQSLRAQLKSISHNDTTVNLSSNRIGFAWFYGYTPKIPAILGGLQSLPPVPANLPQSNTLKFLLQQARLNDGSFVVAIYANNKTRIVEYKNKKLNLKTYSGLKLLKFDTNNGKLSWSY